MSHTPPEKLGAEKNGAVQTFGHSEKSLVAATGLSEEVVVKGRLEGLERGRDWDYVGQAVAYTKKGLRALMKRLGLADAVEPEELERSTAMADSVPSAAVAEVKVTVKGFVLNRHLLKCLDAAGALAWVRVRDREKFKVGMELPVVREGDVYVLTRKEPRWPGRW